MRLSTVLAVACLSVVLACKVKPSMSEEQCQGTREQLQKQFEALDWGKLHLGLQDTPLVTLDLPDSPSPLLTSVHIDIGVASIVSDPFARKAIYPEPLPPVAIRDGRAERAGLKDFGKRFDRLNDAKKHVRTNRKPGQARDDTVTVLLTVHPETLWSVLVDVTTAMQSQGFTSTIFAYNARPRLAGPISEVLPPSFDTELRKSLSETDELVPTQQFALVSSSLAEKFKRSCPAIAKAFDAVGQLPDDKFVPEYASCNCEVRLDALRAGFALHQHMVARDPRVYGFHRIDLAAQDDEQAQSFTSIGAESWQRTATKLIKATSKPGTQWQLVAAP